MMNQKIDTQLRLSLELSQNQRSSELETGFDPDEGTWEIIIKYMGDFSVLMQRIAGVRDAAVLSGGFAVLVVEEDAIAVLAEQKEVIYIDKPKNMFFALQNGTRASCVQPLWRAPLGLSGKGTIACVIDSGERVKRMWEKIC